MYKHTSYTMTVAGTIEGELWCGGLGTRQFSRPVRGHNLRAILSDECNRDFAGGGTVADGWLTVTLHKGNGRSSVREFDLRSLPHVESYMSE